MQLTETQHVPGLARGLLFACAGATVLVCAALAMTYAAGPPSKEHSAWRSFALAMLTLVAIHGGYIAAPFAVGRSWWAWSFWTTAPIGALLVLVPLSMIINCLRWTPPDGASRLPGIMSQVWTLLIAGTIYAGPGVVLWMYRAR